ncbi:uncharacterized protein TRIADDRAFT_60078 [Trichoplax adhaerens]|uniref:G-protein coupled receptors family 1 profile domain-containing protein n=1 Tax=Trichoplax adhaerens TaxID=10228 RepID=B3S787_TRIAD|nr:hypothetical protein TRIADDRAFT_60078 [Trichoplax adhaerens]EDV21440.1 hypothetical protein TRIADDRAFT_60078 [Trichoplax adhaerens]|eukprot:XP_002116040.1 hypothetical protein TRIADDRAFT_60078 [Trichoplax adhaerens]
MSNDTVTSTYFQFYTIFSVLGFVLTIFGFAANLILSYVFITDKNFHKVTYCLILICVLSDSISNIALFFGYTVMLGKLANYESGTVICKLVLFIVFSSYGISFMNLALIAVDRYFAVVRPLALFYRIYKKRILITSELSIFFIVAVIGILGNSQIGVRQEDTRLCDNLNVTNYNTIIMVTSTVIRFIIPSTIIIFFYWRIIVHQRHYVRPGQLTANQQDEELKKRKHIQALLSISAFNVLNTWPFSVIYLIQAIIQKSTYQIRKESPVFFFLSLLSLSLISNMTVLNPFIYLKFDKNVRASVHRIFKRARSLTYSELRCPSQVYFGNETIKSHCTRNVIAMLEKLCIFMSMLAYINEALLLSGGVEKKGNLSVVVGSAEILQASVNSKRSN